MLETKRLILRLVRIDDSTDLMKVFGDKEVMKFSDDGKPQDAEWVRRWIDKAISDYERTGYGVMAVIEKEKNQTIGYCGLFSYDDIDSQSEIEVGYRLARDFWGKGYATEAVQKILKYAHSDLGAARVVAMVDPQNIASKKVAEKTGMTYEKDIMMPGYDHPDLLFVSMGKF